MSRLAQDHPPGATAVAERLAALRQRLARAGAAPGAVRIVAVTKGLGLGAVEAATAAGIGDIGENYASELLAKARPARDQAHREGDQAGPRWHFLGAVQRNKVRSLAPVVHLWQGVTRLAEGEEISRWAPGAAVLVQVEVAGPGVGRGVAPAAVEPLVDGLRALALDVRGLMALGRRGRPEQARPGFARLAQLGRDLGLPELSMGMSDDVEVAVQEGATTVRIGRALLGRRPPSEKLRE